MGLRPLSYDRLLGTVRQDTFSLLVLWSIVSIGSETSWRSITYCAWRVESVSLGAFVGSQQEEEEV